MDTLSILTKGDFIVRSVYLFCIPVLILMVSCGGGSGTEGDNGVVTGPDNGRGDDTQCESESLTQDMYLSTSYDCSHTNNESLLGTWMVTSEYKLVSSATEKNKKSRFTITITETEGNALNAFVCNTEETKRNIRFNSTDNTLSFFDYNARADIELSIVSNKRMTGKHLSGGVTGAIVQASEVTALKIMDTSSEIGKLNLDYTYRDSDFSVENLNLLCFLQDNGTSQNPGLSTQSQGSHFDFIAPLNNNDTDELLISSVFIPEAEGQSPNVGLFFIGSKRKIQGRWSVTANYQDQSNLRTSLSAEVIDDYSLKDHATLSLQLNL